VPFLRILPWNEICEGVSGDTLLETALECGIPLPHECGGEANCTTCSLLILEEARGLSKPEDLEIETLIKLMPKRDPRTRLACQAVFTDDFDGHVEALSLSGR